MGLGRDHARDRVLVEARTVKTVNSGNIVEGMQEQNNQPAIFLKRSIYGAVNRGYLFVRGVLPFEVILK